MGIGDKVIFHLGEKYLKTQEDWAEKGVKLTKDQPTPVKVAGLLGGIAVGTAVGVAKVFSPVHIADTAFKSDDEMEKKSQSWGKFYESDK